MTVTDSDIDELVTLAERYVEGSGQYFDPHDATTTKCKTEVGSSDKPPHSEYITTRYNAHFDASESAADTIVRNSVECNLKRTYVNNVLAGFSWDCTTKPERKLLYPGIREPVDIGKDLAFSAAREFLDFLHSIIGETVNREPFTQDSFSSISNIRISGPHGPRVFTVQYATLYGQAQLAAVGTGRDKLTFYLKTP